MSWLDEHRSSEQAAISAGIAKHNGDHVLALELFRVAAAHEQAALERLDQDKTRTRAITAVSAVSLWYKARDYCRAENLAISVLAGPDTPEFARNELRALVQAIWTENAKAQSGVEFLPGQVTVSVKGGEVVTGGAPLDLIVDKVQTIQAMFYRTIEYLSGRVHRRRGKPSRDILEACRPWLFQTAPGSYQFAVAIQTSNQLDLFRAKIEPEQVAERFLQIVNASSVADQEQLKTLVPEESYRTTFVKLARNLAPDGKSFESMEFRVSGDRSPIEMGMEARQNIRKYLRETKPLKREPESVSIEFKGILRALHLDEDWLEVIVDGETRRVVGLEDAVDDVIGPMVNREVVVRAFSWTNGKFTYDDMEPAE